MVVIRLQGGMGNQLFQYAFARTLGDFKENEIYFDLSSYQKDKLRDFKLDCFHVQTIKTIDRLPGIYQKLYNTSLHKIFRITPVNRILRHAGCITEKNYSPDIEVRKGHVSIYEGYWQSESYFLPVRKDIKNELKVKTEPDAVNQEIINEMKNCESVCVHIRRGDYLTNKKNSKVYNHLTLDYYRDASEIIKQRVQNPVFYIFSDDIPWAKENVHFGNQTRYVDNNGVGKDYEDLRLIYSCRHFIIANSSFSWWGAYLSEHEPKTVVAPHKWFADEKFQEAYQKLYPKIIPQDWILI